jgi:hypothetical protein
MRCKVRLRALGELGADRSAAVEGHGPLQGRGPHVGRDLHRTADPAGVDAGLRRLLDDAADQDGQIGGAVEDEHAVVGQQHRRDSRAVLPTSLRKELSMSDTNNVSPLRQRMIEDMAQLMAGND